MLTNMEALILRSKDFDILFSSLERQRVEINLALDNEEKQGKRCSLVTALVGVDRQQKALINIIGSLECAMLGEAQEIEYVSK